MSEWQTVRWEPQRRVARLTLNRPERRNVLDPTMLSELLQILDEARRDEELSVVLITGAGPAFCGGVDINTPFFMENVQSTSVFEGTRQLNRQHELVEALYELPQATIAMVNGNAIGGGGFGLAMACDMRFAVQGARFWMIPLTVSVVQDYGLTWFLQRACGQPRTFEMVMSGAQITAEQGESWGFINRAFPTVAEMEAHVGALAATIAAAGPDSVRLLKQIVRNGASSSLRDQLQFEAIANGLCFQSDEFKERKRQYFERLRRR
jgi:enoyl-CoA hydratase/carnithine racemase